jgi:hypothetical protein
VGLEDFDVVTVTFVAYNLILNLLKDTFRLDWLAIVILPHQFIESIWELLKEFVWQIAPQKTALHFHNGGDVFSTSTVSVHLTAAAQTQEVVARLKGEGRGWVGIFTAIPSTTAIRSIMAKHKVLSNCVQNGEIILRNANLIRHDERADGRGCVDASAGAFGEILLQNCKWNAMEQWRRK